MLTFTDVILDCPDPWKLAEFYAELLGWEINTGISTKDWVNLRNDGVELSFQRVENYKRPSWPGQEHPQQFHLDFEVDEFEPEHRRVTKLGATLQKSFVGESGYGWQVYVDPAGHPFCLCRNPPRS
ncbi:MULTISPECIES: VOC family protein [unclassified Streptomyces]|uniref:VOC family protein n=1 Tax=unclassified Streptomyces TaxID=2593676 RepID=UPI00224F7353|nr:MULTISPECIES: VOC family protein [unclassified Streptomyces]MCX5052430.1 VOC family protein [Streptomyces sp. NBC_00474]MCX5064175.1 VOC family protein [Streptomyces sp. NBC_00452]